MKQVVIGVDIGSSGTKAVALEKSRILALKTVNNGDVPDTAQRALRAVLQAAGRGIEDIKEIAISGVGARLMRDNLLGLPVTRVDEITAIGRGGLELSGKKKALIVSMGNGTAMVIASDKGRTISHIGGTGVGGGTIEGLSRRMIGVDDFKRVEEMAERGRRNNVNQTVAEAAGGPVGIVPGDATTSNFKKLDTKTDEDDVAVAIFDLVAEVVGMVTVMAAKAYHLEEDVVLVGKVIQSKKIAERMDAVAKIFNMKFCVPKNGDYCTAIGAAKSIM